ncbi:SseB family protein [Streptomyces alkaliphilus]|uniref:SseB family protein n=1 Tax=Streptomyces alkaliphilus TaxID=1472722 RepID=A0A7W3TH75_9ACTN|nr:SseB family protein [Streptomyces alkaliphilus]MBB0246802.1 SseB family protein [Streptomyces alkaliphilus]
MAAKNIPRSPFADDDGSADPALVAALEAWARDPAGEREALTLLSRARLLVPVVAVLGETETGPDGLRREKSSDMAVLTLELPNGRRALPVFTSLASLAAWRGDARPVAVAAPQAVRAAVAERADALVVDVAGPVTREISGPGLRALMTGGSPVTDPAVGRALAALVAAEPAVLDARLVPGGEADGTLVLSVEPGPGGPEAVRRLAGAVAADGTLRAALVRGLQVAVLPPGRELPGDPLPPPPDDTEGPGGHDTAPGSGRA